MNFKNYLIWGISAVAISGCSPKKEIQKTEYSGPIPKILEIICSDTQEIFYDLNSNPKTIEQYVIMKSSKVKENLLMPGVMPYFIDTLPRVMTQKESEQINLKYEFFKK